MTFAAEFVTLLHAFVLSLVYKEDSKRTEYIVFGMSSCEDNECKPNIEAPVVVWHLRYEDIPRGCETLAKEYEDGKDPLTRYMQDTPDAKKLPRRLTKHLRRGLYAAFMTGWVRKGIGLTVEHGVSLVVGLPPPRTQRRGRLDRIADEVLVGLQKLWTQLIDSPEQRRRGKEFSTKAHALVKEVLGDRALDMWTVDSLVSDPAYRRRGYAGALVDTITSQADREFRATMLFSSNLANTEFYNSHGFFEVAHVEVGRDNPSWKGEPVIVPLMIREPQECKLTYICPPISASRYYSRRGKIRAEFSR